MKIYLDYCLGVSRCKGEGDGQDCLLNNNEESKVFTFTASSVPHNSPTNKGSSPLLKETDTQRSNFLTVMQL